MTSQTPASGSSIERIRQGIAYLAGQDPDHAGERNGVGFDGGDTIRGHRLADRKTWTHTDALLAWRLCLKYYRQLETIGIAPGTLVQPHEEDLLPRAQTKGFCLICQRDIARGDAFAWGRERGQRVHPGCVQAEPEAYSSPVPPAGAWTPERAAYAAGRDFDARYPDADPEERTDAARLAAAMIVGEEMGLSDAAALAFAMDAGIMDGPPRRSSWTEHYAAIARDEIPLNSPVGRAIAAKVFETEAALLAAPSGTILLPPPSRPVLDEEPPAADPDYIDIAPDASGLTVREVLGPGGWIARSLPSYEPRAEQLRLAETMERAIAAGENVVSEAGTGTGKSFAYLVAAVLSGKKAIISTGDKALQDQLWQKDVPFLQGVLADRHPFTAAVAKGRSNYVCNWRVDKLVKAGDDAAFGTVDALTAWPDFRDWVAQEELDQGDGDLDTLPIIVPPALRMDVTTDSDGCIGDACPARSKCFAEHMKAKAKRANVVIVNHALLMRDAAVRETTGGFAAVLPDASIIILDEAHHIEDVTTDAFGAELTIARWDRIARRFEKLTTGHKGIGAGLGEHRANAGLVMDQVTMTGATIGNLLDYWHDLLRKVQEAARRNRKAIPSNLKLGDERQGAAEALDYLTDIVKILDNETPPWLIEAEDRADWEKLGDSVSRYYADLHRAALPGDDDVRFLEADRDRLTVKVKPLEVAEILRRNLWNAPRRKRDRRAEQEMRDRGIDPDEQAEDAIPAIIMATSATLSTGGSFAYWRARVGCDRATEVIVDSPFNYRENALLYLPANGADYDPTRFYQDGSIGYFDRMAETIEALLLASDGRAFVLFTSNKALAEVYDRIAPRLRWTVLRQGMAPRPELVRQFKADTHSVLFGLKSFWEGVDVQGEALSLVIIDKLPFVPPDDPVWSARTDLIKRRGGSWFAELALPYAVIALKQGFGRLIRTQADRGAVALLDGRITTKPYGRDIIASLPPARITRDPAAVRRVFE